MRWYGHIIRRNDEHSVKKAVNIPDRLRGTGRLSATWWSNMQKEMDLFLDWLEPENLSKRTTQNRVLWRRHKRRGKFNIHNHNTNQLKLPITTVVVNQRQINYMWVIV